MARDHFMILTAGVSGTVGTTTGQNTPHTGVWTGSAITHPDANSVRQTAVGTSISVPIAVKELLTIQGLTYGPGGKTFPFPDNYEYDLVLRASVTIAGLGAGTSQSIQFVTADDEALTTNVAILATKDYGTAAPGVGVAIRANANLQNVRKYVGARIVTVGTAPGTYMTVQAWIDVA